MSSPLRITREGGRIRMRDRAAPYWALGLFLFFGGAVALAMALGLAPNAGDMKPWERLASVALGLAGCVGALWWLARNHATELQVDLARRRLRLVRWGITGRRVLQLSLDQLERVELEQGRDSDGDPIWRPAVRLRSQERVLLSHLWDHDEAGVRAGAAAFADACRIPLG